MSIQSEPTDTQFIIKVGLLSANMQTLNSLDIVLQKDVGNELVKELEQEGAAVEMAVKGQKSGEILLLVQIIHNAILLGQDAWQHGVLLSQNIETIEHLWTVFTVINGVAGKIQQAWKKRQPPPSDPKKPLRIRIEVDKAAIELEVDPDNKSDQEMTLQMIQQFIQRYPEQAKQISEHSQIVIHGILPNQEDESVQ